MTITDALQDKDNLLRISNGDRWLCGDGENGWIVYERKPYSRHTTIVLETISEDDAVESLLAPTKEV